ncbi:hypothetical protein [Evansella halocellulosilytica]|uniref:hypothetical protein n=1 Tax=Evansella halocellulosilytica TaxID=2011013 RepID=UPI000BB6DFB9|nr:hypothetical protein [Evansella halocellulosilytica]
MNKWLSFIVGILFVDLLFHSGHAYAIGLKATTLFERLSALLFTLILTILFYYLCRKFFSNSFFHGVLFSSGFFASFDIIVVHWIFQLHRLTHGPEANILEPFLVVVGITMMIYAITRERNEEIIV